jgi:SAM-dependent methyltransferase
LWFSQGFDVGYVFSLTDAERQNRWFESARAQRVLKFQRELFRKVWAPVSPQRVLEVGCGSGIFLEWFMAQGHMATGLDPSSSSLDLARRRLGSTAHLNKGFAENLPYDDNEFDTVALVNTLEFVEEPFLALKEAFRVARRNVLLGVFNKYSTSWVHYFFERFWKDSVYDHARFFSVFQLREMSAAILSGAVPIEWRTCFSFPLPLLDYFYPIEKIPLVQRHPFGYFIAMRIDMRCRLRALQTPVFDEIPAGAKVSMETFGCWRTSEGHTAVLPHGD